MANMQQALGLADPLLPYKFELIFSGPIIQNFVKDSDEFKFRVQAFALPGLVAETHVGQYTDARIVYTGRTNISSNDWNVSLLESSNMTIHDILYKMFKSQHDPITGAGNISKNNKFSAVANMYNMANELTGSYNLTGIFVKTLPNIQMSVAPNGIPVVNQIVFSIDWVEGNSVA